MVRPRGIGNKNAIQQFNDSISGSGTLRVRETAPDNFLYDVNAPVIQLQKNQAIVDAVGRIQAPVNIFYVPGYDVGIGTAATSGFTTTSAGIYHVTANVAVSGISSEMYTGGVLIDGVIASGTQSFQYAGPDGATSININGVVHANVGQVINVGVRSVRDTLTTVGSEDLVHAPAANMTIIKLPSDELSFNG